MVTRSPVENQWDLGLGDLSPEVKRHAHSYVEIFVELGASKRVRDKKF